jgi:hypothetical protein
MRTSKFAWMLAMTSAAALAGCGSGKKEAASDDFLEGAPEESALALSVTDDSASEDLATESDSVVAAEVFDSVGEIASGLAPDAAPALQDARDAVRRLNQSLRSFMQPIVALVRETAPTLDQGSMKTWGPVTRGATEFRFTIRRGLLHHYGWLLQARPAGSTADFANVAAGGITVGFAARRGRGTVGLDLDALGAADPTVVARGTLLAGFAHGPNGSALGYRLHGFTPDPQAKAPIDAILQGVHLAEGHNRLRLAYHGNLPESATSAEELVLVRIRHTRGEGGRADLLVTGGDVANGAAWIVSECWNTDLQSAYRIVRECPRDGIGGATCRVVSTQGDPLACARSVADAELPPSDAMAPMSDSESPEGDVTPPDAMPEGVPPADQG